MRKNIIPLLTVILLLFAIDCLAVTKKTYLYAEKEGRKLYLDHYKAEGVKDMRPCVIFVHGGSFARGTRDANMYISYFKWLCSKGYDVVSLSYRLGMSPDYDNYGWKKGAIGTAKRYKKAIQWAAEDLMSATAFVLDSASNWKIAEDKIVACGSSAGAITCLQVENILCNGKSGCEIIPKDFNYKSIVSFAGAIFSMSGHPKWKKLPCPIMFFHGNADDSVPYHKAAILWIGLWGSDYIVNQLDKKKSPYWFHSAIYRDHSMATEPMDKDRDEIKKFLDETVEKSGKPHYRKDVHDPAYPECNTKFSTSVYLRQ